MTMFQVRYVFHFQSGMHRLDCGLIEAATPDDARRRAEAIRDTIAAASKDPVLTSEVYIESARPMGMFGGACGI